MAGQVVDGRNYLSLVVTDNTWSIEIDYSHDDVSASDVTRADLIALVTAEPLDLYIKYTVPVQNTLLALDGDISDLTTTVHVVLDLFDPCGTEPINLTKFGY